MTLDFDEQFKRDAIAAFDAGIGEAASELRDYIVERKLSGQLLNVRSGALRSGMRHRKLGVGRWRVSNNLPYAQAHEDGATITPKRGKYLAIPVGKALTPAGVARYKSPRQVPDLAYIPRRGKSPLLAKKKRGGGLDVYYVLVKQTTLRKRRWMGSAFQERKDKIDERVAQIAKRSLGL